MNHPLRSGSIVAMTALAVMAMLIACSNDQPAPSTPDPGAMLAAAGAQPAAPGGLVTVGVGTDDLQFWPYTSGDLSDTPYDPINLVFVGNVDPRQIRAALMSLDGDRTAYGFPDAFPFNSRWEDANGSVQGTWTEAEGWTGAVVQLQAGAYGPMRFHLRLFRTGAAYDGGGGWTLGGCHLDVLIPGTPEHAVVSWDIPELMVMVDLVRSGLLGAMPDSTDVITATPTFRTIPAPIFNGLPDALKVALRLPTGQSATDVPIPNDGMATILTVAGAAPVAAGTWSQAFDLPFGQLIPKPFCIDGPTDYVWVEGPVSLSKEVTVGSTGTYDYTSRIFGRLSVTPMDVTVSPPVPAGLPYMANISDSQNGMMDMGNEHVRGAAKRIAPQGGGTELLMERILIALRGNTQFSSKSKCLD